MLFQSAVNYMAEKKTLPKNDGAAPENTTPHAQKNKKGKKALIVALIVLASLILLLAIVGVAGYYVLKNIYNEAFYVPTVDIVDRETPYVQSELKTEDLVYMPNEMTVETANTVFYQGDNISKDGIKVVLKYFDGKEYFEKECTEWWISEKATDVTSEIGDSVYTVTGRVLIGGIHVYAKAQVPVKIIARPDGVDTPAEGGELYKVSASFNDFGYSPIDPLSIYSEEILESIKDGHISTPIYKKEQIDKDVFNVLFIGQGDTTNGEHIDLCETIMVVSYNKKTNKVTATSLLRDTLVDIDGYGWNKLRVAYRIGGAGLLINTVNETYGLDIQYFVEADIARMVAFVDRIGGVTVDVTEEQIKSLALTDIEAGKALLKGDNLHNWLVYGGTGADDLSRTSRQGAVIRSIISTYLTGEKKIKELIDICLDDKYVITNLEYDDVLSIGLSVVKEADGFVFSHVQLPGAIGDKYTYVCYKEKVLGINVPVEVLREMAKDTIYPAVKD